MNTFSYLAADQQSAEPPPFESGSHQLSREDVLSQRELALTPGLVQHWLFSPAPSSVWASAQNTFRLGYLLCPCRHKLYILLAVTIRFVFLLNVLLNILVYNNNSLKYFLLF